MDGLIGATKQPLRVQTPPLGAGSKANHDSPTLDLPSLKPSPRNVCPTLADKKGHGLFVNPFFGWI